MATKASRQGAVIVTPPPLTREKVRYSKAEKQTLLDNFDLEVEDKTRAFRASLAATLASFVMRQETEILKIPRDLRGMTLADLEPKYSGTWSSTLQRIARDKLEEREKEDEAKEKERKEEEAVKGKRKRATGNTSDSSPGRNNKNARRDAGKKTSARKTTRTPLSKSSHTQGPSSLPQNHVFNPNLPSTPFARKAKRNESFFSANGSPIAAPFQPPSDAEGDRGPLEQDSDDSEDSDELPDPEALEAKLQARAAATASPRSKSSNPSRPSSRSQPSHPSRKPKRAPSLMFRQSLGAGALLPSAKDHQDEALSSIPLADGRTVSFNPLNLSPDEIEREMVQGGLSKEDRENLRERIKEHAIHALSDKMNQWGLY